MNNEQIWDDSDIRSEEYDPPLDRYFERWYNG